MQLIFSDNNLHLALAPLTLTRPVSTIRFGILTLEETWVKMLDKRLSTSLTPTYQTEAYLNAKFPEGTPDEKSITLAGNIKPTQEIAEAVANLGTNEALMVNNQWVATKGTTIEREKHLQVDQLLRLERCWHIFQHNGAALAIDFDLLTENAVSAPLSSTNQVIQPENVFIAPGAKVECAILNASGGPIYIGPDAEIMEGAIIRGPFALCDHATVKMGAKIYGPTTIGPHCKVGGEISNSVFQAYSNKGHDGFLGNSVVGEWCNFGADTNSSNLKNNYSNVKVFDYSTGKIESSSVLFCGVMMGDHSKTGINTMLNTATVVGVCANIFGGDFPPKYIPSYTWGGVNKTDRFILEKAFEVAENMMKRRHIDLSEGDRAILTHLYNELA